MKSCIILNGKISDYKFIKSIIKNENYDYIICADGGANHAYEMEIFQILHYDFYNNQFYNHHESYHLLQTYHKHQIHFLQLIMVHTYTSKDQMDGVELVYLY